MYALIDCNACYASCEQIFRPDLRDKPIVVLSNNDGCIVTRNKEAKALNIPDLQPYFMIKEQLAALNVEVFSSNYALYADISDRIMTLLSSLGKTIEVYSIDEAFLDVSGFSALKEHGKLIKKACWQQQRMPVSVGIASTKTLAKLANHIAKRSKRLNGVCIIENIDSWQAVFNKLLVNKIWGIGNRLSLKLNQLGINTVQDFMYYPVKPLRQQFGIVLERTYRELHGTACITFEHAPVDKKSIVCSRSFGKKTGHYCDLKEAVTFYTSRAAEKLRKQNSQAQIISVMVSTGQQATPYYHNSIAMELAYPSQHTPTLIQAAITALSHLYKAGYEYAKAGVSLLSISTTQHHQADWIGTQEPNKHKSIMYTIDSLNQRYGKNTLFFASQGIEQSWKMRRDKQSPAYTTRIQDIPIVLIK